MLPESFESILSVLRECFVSIGGVFVCFEVFMRQNSCNFVSRR
jgi:hypothetical protein